MRVGYRYPQNEWDGWDTRHRWTVHVQNVRPAFAWRISRPVQMFDAVLHIPTWSVQGYFETVPIKKASHEN